MALENDEYIVCFKIKQKQAIRIRLGLSTYLRFSQGGFIIWMGVNSKIVGNTYMVNLYYNPAKS